ncbi:MAG: integrase core domain-containing protein [Sphingomonadaceae bacterium]
MAARPRLPLRHAHPLRRWETVYNTIRPHQALGYLTPKRFLEHHYRQHPREEEVPRT